ncbi:MAG TPA: hypothetical protein ENJ82_10605 [Bacteroidetes bacterium]|nr:hypothetical protein [Bacteroidota bacterium]
MNDKKNILKSMLFVVGILFFAPQLQAQSNPCLGDKIGIRAGTGMVEISRRDCDMIVLNYDKYFALEVASRQNDSLKSSSLTYLNSVTQNIALRDSLDKLRKNYVNVQESQIKQYQTLVDDYKKAAEDALANAKNCERQLTLQRLKTPIYAIGGAVAGALVGILVGKTLAP